MFHGRDAKGACEGDQERVSHQEGPGVPQGHRSHGAACSGKRTQADDCVWEGGWGKPSGVVAGGSLVTFIGAASTGTQEQPDW